MNMIVSRVFERDLNTVFEIQHAAFKQLYEKYHDNGSNPYTESKETTFLKYTRPGSSGYLFILDGKPVGTVRISISDVCKSGRISALCVLPQYQGMGIAQKGLLEIERLHPDVTTWFLETILEETGICHLYEKIGYQKTGRTKRINEKMTLVSYEKK